ncbi:hypothetical protein SK128_024585 [Halocaridina rubra]|uniref:Uncharacterized protein n=1 Tax=Halocaridina rubra TaxID=373956 RepID=A0AAN8XK05_HALRR
MEGYASEVGNVLQQKLRPLDQALREEMEETRVAVNDQSSNIEKVSQAVSNTAYMSEQLLSEVKNQFLAQRVIFQEKIDETKNLFLQYCAYGNSGNPAPRQPSYEPREPSYAPPEPTYTPRQAPYLPNNEPVTETSRTPYYSPVTQATSSSRLVDFTSDIHGNLMIYNIFESIREAL